MAGGQERILRRRIRSVQSTMKITRAMELIAASRILKAQAQVAAATPYANMITDVVGNLASAGAATDSPLLVGRPEIRRVGLIVVGADRGLCGGYNTLVIRAAEGLLREHDALGRDYHLVAVGRKVESYFRYRHYRLAAALTGFSDQPTYEDARAISHTVSGPFVDGDVDLVQIVYTRFVSAGFQEVLMRPLMPLDRETVAGEDSVPGEAPASAYEFEPEPSEILERLLPRYVEARVYAALLNAAASEHSARQRAMRAATDNASELITGLTRVMNRARQDSITTEIMEIVGGAEALRGGTSARIDHMLETVPAEATS
jgi:F-type H+-transporting ATPase subunit gamma